MVPNGNPTINTNTPTPTQTQQSNSGPNTPNSQVAEEEPLYVNAKQYHRILKRRQARNKLENEGRIPKIRQVRKKNKKFKSQALNFISF